MQKYHSKAWSRFAKYVGILTGKPRKLVLHFSDFSVFLYEFSKIQDLDTKELRILFFSGPWFKFLIHNDTLRYTPSSLD
jgi:hypothetical protein